MRGNLWTKDEIDALRELWKRTGSYANTRTTISGNFTWEEVSDAMAAKRDAQGWEYRMYTCKSCRTFVKNHPKLFVRTPPPSPRLQPPPYLGNVDSDPREIYR